MADDLPRLDLGLTGEGKPVVMLGTTGQATDMAALLRLAPALASPAHADDLARAVNHLAHSGEFRVITDPKVFEEAYRTRLSHEDPNAPWQEGVIRLRDHGIPDFTEISKPRFEGGRLTFFAADMFLGVPYRVELADLKSTPAYTPLPLTPLADAPHQASPAEEPAIDREAPVNRETHMQGDVPH